jgi:hypothetical protein
MYKGTITSSTAYTAGTNIPFAAQINSNSATATGSGTVTLLKAGYYNIFANINATGAAAGNVTAQVTANGTALSSSAQTQTSAATTDALAFNLIDTIYVRPAAYPSRVTLAVTLSAAATIDNANFIVQRVK